MFHPGVNGSHPFSTIDTWDKYWPFAASLHGEGFFVLPPTAYRYCYRPPVQKNMDIANTLINNPHLQSIKFHSLYFKNVF